MLFGDDDLRKSQIGFCFGSTTNLYFFPYEVSRRSSHSNRGSGRFHKGDFTIYISVYAHAKVRFAICYWIAHFETYCIEHWNISCFEKHRVIQILYAAYFIWFDKTKSILLLENMTIASLLQLGKDGTLPWISKAARRGLFHFRNQLQSFIIRLHSSNRNLCSAWVVIRFQFNKVLLRVQLGISFLRANFAMRTLYTALSKYCLDYSWTSIIRTHWD